MKNFLSYNEAKEQVRKHNLRTLADYKKNYKKVYGLPSPRYISTVYPEFDYKDFFGREKSGNFDDYSKFLKFVNDAKIKSKWEYRNKYKASNYSLPSSPETIYSEFTSWNNILGRTNLPTISTLFKKKNFVGLEEAKKIISELKKSGIRLNNRNDYKEFVNSEEYKNNYSEKLPKVLEYYRQSNGYKGSLDILGDPVDVTPSMYSLDELKDLISKRNITDLDSLTVYMFNGPNDETSRIPSDIEEHYGINLESDLFSKQEETVDNSPSIDEVLSVINKMEAMLEELKSKLR